MKVLLTTCLLAITLCASQPAKACMVLIVGLPELVRSGDQVFVGKVSKSELKPFELGGETGQKGWILITPLRSLRGELPPLPVWAPVASLEVGSAPWCIEPQYVPDPAEILTVWITRGADGASLVEFSPGAPSQSDEAEIRKQRRE